MNPQQAPIDYLNQIAPTKQPTDFMKSLKPIHFIIGGVILLILLIVSIIYSQNAANEPKVQLETLAARMASTLTIARAADANIKDGNLEVANSNLEIYLTSLTAADAKPFATLGVNTKSVPSTIIAAEKDPGGITEDLENAHLNAVFDTTYARDIAYQLATLVTLMREIYQSTGDKAVKSFLETAYNNLQPTQQYFSTFTTNTE